MRWREFFPGWYLAAAVGIWSGFVATKSRVWGDDIPRAAAKADPGRLFVVTKPVGIGDPAAGRLRGIFAVDPGANAWEQLGAPDLVDGIVSPDRRRLAAGPPAGAAPARVGVWVYALAGASPERRAFDRPWFSCCWSDGGQRLIISAPAGPGKPTFETYRVDADGANLVKLPILANEVIMDCTRDGGCLASSDFAKMAERQARIVLMRPDGTERRAIVDEPGVARSVRFSPDGGRLAYGLSAGEPRQFKTSVWVVDRDGGNRARIPIEFEPGTSVQIAWSPDGKRLALGLTTAGVRGGGIRVMRVDLDGKNQESLPQLAGSDRLLDWK